MRVMLLGGSQAEAVDLAGAPEGLPDKGWYWIDCDYEQSRDWVDAVAAISGIQVYEDHLLDAENRQHPSCFDATRDYEVIVFRGLESATESGGGTRTFRIRTRPTVFFIFPGCLVTIRSPDSRSVPVLRKRILESVGGRQRAPQSPEELMLRLLNLMVDRYLELRQPLTEQLERWQRMLLDPRKPFSDWYALLQARGELRRLEQLCEEQLDAIQEWRDARLDEGRGGPLHAPRQPGSLPMIGDPLLIRTSDLVEHVQRVLNHARRLEQSVETAVQLPFSSTAHRTNEIMRTLTTLTAVFMPLTLITGIFGMNFEFIPGVKAHEGFWWTLAAMALIALTMLAWFRARRYLDSGESLWRRRARASGAQPAPGENDRPPDG